MLFMQACKNTALGRCERCNKPVCADHRRIASDGEEVCISCAREALKSEKERFSFAFLRDDPFFYWYFETTSDEVAFTQEDFDLFAEVSGQAIEGVAEMFDGDPWQGT
jgi:hypothetical protein